MLIGYARVSTDDQDLALQRAALREAGCRRIYEEKLSGARRDRPQLARLLDQVREGDVVVVYRLDRLARSTRDLLEIAEQLREAGAGLRSLGEPWADTTSPAGRMVLTVFAGIAEFERALIQERTGAGTGGGQAARRALRPARQAGAPSRSPWRGACSRRAPPPARWRACSRSTAPPSTGPSAPAVTMMHAPGSEADIRAVFAQQAAWCRELGSPLTGLLCELLGRRLDRSTRIGRLVLDWPVGQPALRFDALPLRLAGGLHALVRRGRLPALARLYPPRSMPQGEVLWREVAAALGEAGDELEPWLARAPQTNEVARAAALMAGLLAVTASYRPAVGPLRAGCECRAEPDARPVQLPARRAADRRRRITRTARTELEGPGTAGDRGRDRGSPRRGPAPAGCDQGCRP